MRRMNIGEGGMFDCCSSVPTSFGRAESLCGGGVQSRRPAVKDLDYYGYQRSTFRTSTG